MWANRGATISYYLKKNIESITNYKFQRVKRCEENKHDDYKHIELTEFLFKSNKMANISKFGQNK